MTIITDYDEKFQCMVGIGPSGTWEVLNPVYTPSLWERIFGKKFVEKRKKKRIERVDRTIWRGEYPMGNRRMYT